MSDATTERVSPLPCPFCGNDPISEGNHGGGCEIHTAWNVTCIGGEHRNPRYRKGLDGCPVEPEVEAATEEEAITAWNTRAHVYALPGAATVSEDMADS